MVLDIFKFLLFFVFVIYPLGRAVLFQISDSKEFEIIKSAVLGLLIVSVALKFLFAAVVISWIYIHRKIDISFPHPNWLLIILTLFIIILNIQILYPFGQITPNGISLYGAHFIDSTWHLALINSLLRSVPPENPDYAGVVLKNYHYFTDLQMAIVHRFTSIPVEKIFFILIGPLYLSLTSFSLYSFVRKVFESKTIAVFSVLLIVSASNWYYLARYIYPQAAISPSVAWMDFYSSKTVNFPLLYSLALLFVLLEVISSRPAKIKSIITLGLISGFMFMVKSHTALVLLLSLAILGIIQAFKKQWSVLMMALIGIATCFILATSTLSSGSSSLLFSPMWFIKVMYESPFHLNTPDWELKRQFLLSIGAYLGVAKLYAQGITFFIVVNFGLGLLGILYYAITFFRSRDVEKLLVIIFAVSLGLTSSFIYLNSSTVTIQFIYTAFISSQLLLLAVLKKIFKSRDIIVISTIYWVSLLPGIGFINNQYASLFGQQSIPLEVTRALVFARSLPPGAILTSPEFWSGSYVPAYSGHSVYLGDLDTIKGSGIEISTREQTAKRFFGCQQKLPDGVKYVFTSQNLCVDRNVGLMKIFSNSKISIYETKL